MATAFDRWEKDPFFYAAEEVQESADRMESVYRRWIHEKSAPEAAGGDADALVKLQRELHIALGTAKWQLEELEKAVRSSDHALSAGESTTTRHSDFAAAISGKISMVENALKESNLEEDGGLAWVRLDEGERDELALFLSCPNHEAEKALPTPSAGVHEVGNRVDVNTNVCSKNPCQSNELSLSKVKEEEEKCHRRVASASADLGVWKISVSVEASPQKLLDEHPNFPPPRILSLSELRNMESASKPKWYKNGFRKWRAPSHEDVEETIPLQNHHLSRGINACYEKGKSCLRGCTDESYNKELYGWFEAFQRQVQRSQYQIQYGRPVQMIILTVLTVILIVFVWSSSPPHRTREKKEGGFQIRMTSASELFHSRRSRTSRRTQPELGFNRLLADRDPHQLRHSLLRRRRRLGRREDRESSRQHQAFSLQEPEAGSSNNRNVGDSGTSSIIANGAVVSDRINRMMLARNDRLPAFVLQARARVLERLRGTSSRLVEAASSFERFRNLHGSGRQSMSSSLQEQSQDEIPSMTSLSELREAMAASSIYWEDFTSLDEGFVFESPLHFFYSDSGPEPELSIQNYTRMYPGLSLESIQGLPLEVFKDAEDGDRGVLLECCICLERFSNGDELLLLPCAHRFHVACLKPWLRRCGGCPYCRARI